MIPIFTATVTYPNMQATSLNDYCDLLYTNPRSYQTHLKTFIGQRVEVIIRKPKTKRSDLQNKYYWGVVLTLLSDKTGFEADELHEVLKFKFLRTQFTSDYEYVKSTTKLSTGEFEEYLEKIRRWAAEFLNINIPLPNECEAA